MTFLKKFGMSLLLWLFISVALLSQFHCPDIQYKDLRKNALDTAKNYIGIRETSYNSSPVIDVIIKSGGGVPGYSWCMYFVMYCYKQSYQASGQQTPLRKQANCSLQLANCLHDNKFTVFIVNESFKKYKAQKGDIAIFHHGVYKPSMLGKYWLGHTGLVESQLSDTKVQTVEGNTNIAGTRESRGKDGVFQKQRNIYTSSFPIVAFIRVK